MEPSHDTTAPGIHAVSKEERILSVDVLRGFDMFWLIGGTGFALAIAKLLPEPFQSFFVGQMDHADWVGFTFYDLIFPLFVFVTGMSVVFSLGKLLQERGRAVAYRRILRRVVLLYLLGVLYYGAMNHLWSEIRWLGVLQRIALCYGIAAILFCHLSTRALVAVCASILLGYWVLLACIPLPGHSSVSWAVGENWACYLDSLLLPGRKHDGTWDPEGLLSTLPAVCTCLLGVFASQIMLAKNLSSRHKLAAYLAGGALMVVAGFLWGLHFPVIKKVWTSSYVLVAGGYSFMLLGLFYLIVDLWKVRWWITPFIWIGSNALTIYLARNFVDFNAFAERFMGGSLKAAVSEDVAYLLQMTVSLGLSLLVVRFLYRNKIFLRV